MGTENKSEMPFVSDMIQKQLFEIEDKKYADFQRKLIPNIAPERIIGVRTPELKKMAKALAKDSYIDAFLKELPHQYFEEDQLHAFLIAGRNSYEACLQAVDAFLPYVNNWATCDQLSPKIFGKHRMELMESIRRWIRSDATYTVRFAIGMLMRYYLDDAFDLAYPEMVASVQSEEYYIRMMVAWYFATALAKQYDAILPFIKEKKLESWTHNKAIQKAQESYRITPEQKAYLKTLKIPAAAKRRKT